MAERQTPTPDQTPAPDFSGYGNFAPLAQALHQKWPETTPQMIDALLSSMKITPAASKLGTHKEKPRIDPVNDQWEISDEGEQVYIKRLKSAAHAEMAYAVTLPKTKARRLVLPPGVKTIKPEEMNQYMVEVAEFSVQRLNTFEGISSRPTANKRGRMPTRGSKE